MTKRRQRRINRADYLRYKSRSSLPPVTAPAPRWGLLDWTALVVLSFTVNAILLWILL